MRRFVLVVPALTLWLCRGLAGQAQEDEARALLAKAIQAHGGPKALATLSAVQHRGKGQVYTPLEAPFTAELLSQFPDKNKIALAVEVKGAIHMYTKVL